MRLSSSYLQAISHTSHSWKRILKEDKEKNPQLLHNFVNNISAGCKAMVNNFVDFAINS